MSALSTSKPAALYYAMMQYQPSNRAMLDTHFAVTELPNPSADEDEILARVQVLFAPLGYFVSGEKMDKCPNLKVIVSNTTGVSHIDVKAAAVRNVAVVSLADDQVFLDNITPTAEHTWGLLLALTRNTVRASRSVLDGEWNRRPWPGRRMLSRMSLGIIGLGRLGMKVARYGEAFGMTVRYYDPHVGAQRAGLERCDSLKHLVSQTDVISLHVPANAQTRGMIDESVFRAFKPGSWFINTARGEPVVEVALLAALESGHLAGAAVDVLEDEFNPEFDATQSAVVQYAQQHDNLLITPHIGGSTIDAWTETEERVIQKSLTVLGIGND